MKLCRELIRRVNSDQQARHAALQKPPAAKASARVKQMDERNTRYLVDILEKRKVWPGKSHVGERGSGAAWTLFQHATPEVQARFLPMLEAAADAGELEWPLLATTIDRVLINQGRPQRYGTQFVERAGEWVPSEIEDEENVDARRAAVGLPPLSEYKALMRAVYGDGKGK